MIVSLLLLHLRTAHALRWYGVRGLKPKPKLQLHALAPALTFSETAVPQGMFAPIGLLVELPFHLSQSTNAVFQLLRFKFRLHQAGKATITD